MNTYVVYFLILFLKIIEVTLATTRIVLITKGEKIKGAIIGFFEVFLWIMIVSSVLDDMSNDPYKILVYALGFSLGNYLGSVFEEKLGFGTIRIEIIVHIEKGQELADSLRDQGLAVTVLEGDGMHHKRNVLLMHIKRKNIDDTIHLIRELEKDVVITINEVKPIYGGYGILKK